jgi:PAS domain S-box-containing protein
MGNEEALRERKEELEREIARRRQAEEELREMQGFLASLLEHAPISIYIASTDGRLRLVNRAWEEFWGLSREKAIGLRSEQIYPAAQARQYLEANQRVIDSAAPVIAEETGDAPDGRHYFHTVKFPLRDAHGEIEAVGGISIDITERKQMESQREAALEALRKRNLDLEILNRAARAFSSTLDLDQVLATVLEEIRGSLNVAACSVWLIDRDSGDLVCRQATGPESDLVRGWRLAPDQGIVGWVVRQGESSVVMDTRLDERHYRVVDQKIGYELRSILSVPLRTTQGVLGAIQVVDTQVGRFTAADLELVEPLAATAAVAIENAGLYQEANRLRAFNENIIQSIGEGIAIIDVDGRLVFINPRGAAIIDSIPEELIGQDWRLFIAPETLARTEAEAANRPQGLTGQYETSALDRDGRRIPLIVSSRPLFEGEQFAGTLAAFVDISERKKAEEERERLIAELKEALANIKTLKGLVPICASCKKIRTDEGFWQQVEVYIRDHSEVEFSHGLCPDCLKKLYPEFAQDE